MFNAHMGLEGGHVTANNPLLAGFNPRCPRARQPLQKQQHHQGPIHFITHTRLQLKQLIIFLPIYLKSGRGNLLFMISSKSHYLSAGFSCSPPPPPLFLPP